jgi:signal transduction histidine kinase
VRISGRSTGREHQLVVDDEGPGIPPEQRTRVLERFYRSDGWREQAPGGVGLGLAIVHGAVTANRGRVEIESNESGGTRVILSLPRHEATLQDS